MKRHKSCLPLVAAAALVVVASVSGPGQSRAQGAHGQGHNALHHWYLTLRDRAGRSCCSNVDCRPTLSREREGRVEVIIDGEWTPVPREKILSRPSPDLGSHVCSPKQPSIYPKGHIFCVVLGSGV